MSLHSKRWKRIWQPTVAKRVFFYLLTDGAVVFTATLLTIASHPHLREHSVLADFLFVSLIAFVGVVSFSFIFSSYLLRWATFSFSDLPRAIAPSLITTGILAILSGLNLVPITILGCLNWGLLNITGILAVRTSKRIYYDLSVGRKQKNALMVVSADKSYFLLDVLRRIPYFRYKIVGFIDPNPNNRGTLSHGLPVLGTLEEIEKVVKKHRIETVFIALSTDHSVPLGSLYSRLHQLNIQTHVIPSLNDFINNPNNNGQLSTRLLEHIILQDLIGRTPVRINPEELAQAFAQKTIMVTGAGGSIGSELCRQLARFNPALLVLFERDDSNLFYIENELRLSYPELKTYPYLGDITHQDDVTRIFEKTKPNIIFHTAAYKHVPILEFYPSEAVKTNVLGTYILALAAVQYGVDSFVYISTDKAVNPVSVMGATKRLGEIIVTSMNGLGDVHFIAVRFGNVLASRGSVLTIFIEAINQRKPIFITHENMQRYFMLNSEAALLVMQATAIGKGGEVFVLDMGNPVKIIDIANSLIRAAGLKPNVDIPIIITGLRPGERETEEIFSSEEETTITSHQKILKVKISRQFSHSEIVKMVNQLEHLVAQGNQELIQEELTKTLPEYQPHRSWLNTVPTASGHLVNDLNQK